MSVALIITLYILAAIFTLFVMMYLVKRHKWQEPESIFVQIFAPPLWPFVIPVTIVAFTLMRGYGVLDAAAERLAKRR